MNTARNIIEYPCLPMMQNKSNNTGSHTENSSNKQWHYIDLDEFEDMIRNEERVRLFDERMDIRNVRKIKEKKSIKNSRYFMVQKLIGLFVIIVTLCFGEPFALDGTFILTIINVLTGIILLLSKKKLLYINK